MTQIEEIYNILANKYGKERGWSITIDAPYFKEVIYPAIVGAVKLHVQAALKEASENAEITYTEEKTWDFTEVDKDSILNAYPETNIV